MAHDYRLFGAELSPYSVKVRSYLRLKGIQHHWIIQNASNRAEFERYARIPIIPLLVTPANIAIQDSTPILDHMERLYPKPSVHPDDPVSRFVSVLMEEFGDEWGNKWMFHYRWARDVDQISAAGRVARMHSPIASEAEHAMSIKQVKEKFAQRVWFVGSNTGNAPQIEASFLEMLSLLDGHLRKRPYMFGGRPAYGDFGLWGQIYELWTDPTSGALINGSAPHVLDWVQRMLWPRADGLFEEWASLEETLMPILIKQVGNYFWPWTLANENAISKRQEEFSVSLGDGVWNQKAQKYHVRSLEMLRAKYEAVRDKIALDQVLESAGCLAGLQSRTPR